MEGQDYIEVGVALVALLRTLDTKNLIGMVSVPAGSVRKSDSEVTSRDYQITPSVDFKFNKQ
jgi:hypothetical protein